MFVKERQEKQCLALGEKLKDLHIDAYITSPLLRAFKTAMGVCNAKTEKPLLQIMPEIIEYGAPVGYYGCSEEYLNKYYSNTKMCEKLFGTEKYEFGTYYYSDNSLRAKKVIDYIKEKYSFGNRVILFSHHGASEYLIREAFGIEKQTFDIALDNTSLQRFNSTETEKLPFMVLTVKMLYSYYI